MSDDWMKDYGKRPTRSALNAVAYVDSKSARIEELERELYSERNSRREEGFNQVKELEQQLAAERALADQLWDAWQHGGYAPDAVAAYRKARGM